MLAIQKGLFVTILNNVIVQQEVWLWLHKNPRSQRSSSSLSVARKKQNVELIQIRNLRLRCRFLPQITASFSGAAAGSHYLTSAAYIALKTGFQGKILICQGIFLSAQANFKTSNSHPQVSAAPLRHQFPRKVQML